MYMILEKFCCHLVENNLKIILPDHSRLPILIFSLFLNHKFIIWVFSILSSSLFLGFSKLWEGTKYDSRTRKTIYAKKKKIPISRLEKI